MKRRSTNKIDSVVFPRIVNQPSGRIDDLIVHNSDPAHKFARRRKWRRTLAEKEFEKIVRGVGNGFLTGKFETEWAICGKWILDFYFPEHRLAVEIDGEYHNDPEQKERDRKKAADCEVLEITLLHLSNDEVLNRSSETEYKLLQYLEIAAERTTRCTKIVPQRIIRLTKREKDLIKRHLKFYEELASRERQPTTAEQEHFVAVLKGDQLPNTIHEVAFAKFILMQSETR